MKNEINDREQNVCPPSAFPAAKLSTNNSPAINYSCSAWELPAADPWPAPVDGNALLDELAALLRRFVVLPQWGSDTLALWVLHTYAFPHRDVSVYLGIESPEKRCGKTTLLSVLAELVHRPVVAANISSPAFFRVIAESRPTLLIDEADTFLQGNDELRGILNSGYHRKTAYVVRVAHNADLTLDKRSAAVAKPSRSTVDCAAAAAGFPGAAALQDSELPNAGAAPVSFDHVSRFTFQSSTLARFSCWCPKAIAAIGRLPDTLADRCIVLRMQRKTPGENCERLRNLDSAALRRQCARFVADHAAGIAAASPEIPADLNDRAADIWEPLLVLADLAGGPWPTLARQAAEGLTARSQESTPIAALLLDILTLLVNAGGERIFSRTLVGGLNRLADRPWIEIRKGKEITDMWLARQLRPYGIQPRTLWHGEISAKGYGLDDFRDVFRRYIPRTEIEALMAGMTQRPPAPPENPPPSAAS